MRAERCGRSSSTTYCIRRRSRTTTELRLADTSHRLRRRNDRPLLHRRLRADRGGETSSAASALAGLFTDESLERVRTAATSSRSARGHTDLRQRGTRWLGLCPFHDERTPSFSVDSSNNLYYCFGCQAGGDVFNFVQEKEGLDFRQAVEHLADRFGVELEHRVERTRGGRAAARPRAPLRSAVQRPRPSTSDTCRSRMRPHEARSYLESRGFGREVLDQFGVGFAPSAWDRILTSAQRSGFHEEELMTSGLAQRGRRGGLYDRFRGASCSRCATPAVACSGSARARCATTSAPKYVNSPESIVYRKGRSLFGIDLARPHATKRRRGDRRRGLHGRARVAPGRLSKHGRIDGNRDDRGPGRRAGPTRPICGPGLRCRPFRPGGHVAGAAGGWQAADSISR